MAAPDVLSVPDVDQSTAMGILQKSVIQKQTLHDNSAAASLLEQLEYLPLAISQAAAYMNENDISLNDYVSLLKEQETSAAELLSEEFENDGRYPEIQQNPVITTWLVSFQQIEKLNALAVECMSFIACINPRDIPQSILPSAPSAKKKMDALGILSAYSFISKHADNSFFSVHRLVHLATRNWMRQAQIIGFSIRSTAQQLQLIFLHDYSQSRNYNTNRKLCTFIILLS